MQRTPTGPATKIKLLLPERHQVQVERDAVTTETGIVSLRCPGCVALSLFEMQKTRRNKPYKVRVLNHKDPHQLAAVWFRDFVSRGLLRLVERKGQPPNQRLAEPRPGVLAWLEAGELRLLDISARWGVRVRLNCTTVERHAEIYRELTPEQVSQWVQREYCVRGV